MNKKQKIVGWCVVVLLAIAVLLFGIYWWEWEGLDGLSFSFTVVIPILLIGGFAFFAVRDDGDKKSKNEQK